MSSAKTGSKQVGGRFEKGVSGNPRGRPAGSRNNATLACEALLEGQAEALTQKAVDMALAGDPVALRLCLERICPVRKDRPVEFSLPPINTARDAANVMSSVMNAVGAGELSPADASELSKVVACTVKSFEAAEFADSLVPLAQLTDTELMRIAAGDDPTVVVSSRSRKLLTLNPR
jgi:hypothetical protein